MKRGQKRTKNQKRRDARYLRERNVRDAEERALDWRMEDWRKRILREEGAYVGV